MPTPPTFVYYETAWNTTASPKTVAISWAANDIIVVLAGADTGTWGAPTCTGLTFVQRIVYNNNSSACATGIWTAVAGSSGSGTVSLSRSGASFDWGYCVTVVTGSDGYAGYFEQHTATKTVSYTASQADSFFLWGSFDFSESTTLGTIVPTPSHTRQRVAISGNYTIYVADLADQTSTGSVAYGISGSSGSGPWSIIGVEIKGAAGAAPPFPPLFGPKVEPQTNTLLRM